MQLERKPYVLVILDGWGHTDSDRANAINTARKPHWDSWWQERPHTLVSASGHDVGLPDAQMGNSEVGHMNIGSGRIVYQDFTRITKSIEEGDFFTNPVLVKAVRSAAANGKSVHILGLLSDGGVHSHQDHIYALLELTRREGVGNVYLHAFLDGRDTPPRSARGYIEQCMAEMTRIGCGRIASLCGRYLAMDRNNNWDRTRLAYELLVDGMADHHYDDPLAAIDPAYQRDEGDEFVRPIAINGASGETVTIADGDVVIFANYRADRARQLTRAFIEPDFTDFTRNRVPQDIAFVTMTRYKEEFSCPAAYPPERLENGLGEFLSRQGLRQLRIAETEKYAHVTFFFNGGEERVFKNEDRILIPSPDVATYDLRPEMSAVEVTDKLVEAIAAGSHDVIICNYANADMVGHTGDFDAAVRAIECLDQCLGRLEEAVHEAGGEMLITSDHGNAEQMKAEDQEESHTAHTTNLVPLLYIGRPAVPAAGTGALCDIAPTLLYLMGLQPPAEMTGRILFEIQNTQSGVVQTARR